MRKKSVHYTICGLNYVYLENIPVRRTSHGEVIAADLSIVEREIAKEIIRRGIPLRGAEVQFLRKTLGMSMQRFGRPLGLSAPAIMKWEKARTKRLAPINEVAVRALIAEQLDIRLDGRFKVLLGISETPEQMMVNAV